MKKNGTPQKKGGKHSGNRTSYLILSRSTSYLLTTRCLKRLHAIMIFILYIYVRIDNLDNSTKKRKEYPPQADDASTAEAAPGRFGRDEQGEAHRANTTPNGEPHLELGRLRFKTWSKFDFSIAQTTWPTHLTHIFILSARAHRKRVHSFRVYIEQTAWTFPLVKGGSVLHHIQHRLVNT